MAEDQILLKVESQDTSEALKTQLSLAFREATKLRTEVALVELDSLPKDGIVIQDTRKIG
jgi:phenylacetate-CoA ligase